MVRTSEAPAGWGEGLCEASQPPCPAEDGDRVPARDTEPGPPTGPSRPQHPLAPWVSQGPVLSCPAQPRPAGTSRTHTQEQTPVARTVPVSMSRSNVRLTLWPAPGRELWTPPRLRLYHPARVMVRGQTWAADGSGSSGPFGRETPGPWPLSWALRGVLPQHLLPLGLRAPPALHPLPTEPLGQPLPHSSLDQLRALCPLGLCCGHHIAKHFGGPCTPTSPEVVR